MLKNKKIIISEVFRSIQGESTFQGQPCTFIRCAGCNLSCSYCDTPTAKSGGRKIPISRLIEKVSNFSKNGLVEITGGEPLIQEQISSLADALLDSGYKVMVETNGSIDVSVLNSSILKVIDVKCPSSGQSGKTYWSNLEKMGQNEQVKFVLADTVDYNWAKKVITDYQLADKSPILMSVVWGKLSLEKLSEWVLEDNLPVIIHPQLHKVIWGSETKR